MCNQTDKLTFARVEKWSIKWTSKRKMDGQTSTQINEQMNRLTKDK